MANSSENIPEVTVDGNALPVANMTWDEYKYRHQLCWDLIFKITLVTATLSIIPYLDNKIIPQAKLILFFTPLVGIGVSTIGGYRLYRELKLLDKIRNLHRAFQKKAYDALYNKLFHDDIHKFNDSNFTSAVSLYLVILNILAVINFIMQLFLIYFKCGC